MYKQRHQGENSQNGIQRKNHHSVFGCIGISEERVPVTEKHEQTWGCYGGFWWEKGMLTWVYKWDWSLWTLSIHLGSFFLTPPISHNKYSHNKLSFLIPVSSAHHSAPGQVCWQALAFQTVVRIVCFFSHVSYVGRLPWTWIICFHSWCHKVRQ